MHKEAAKGWAFMLMNARWEGFGGNIFTICSATRTKTRQTQLWNNKIAALKKRYPSKTIDQVKQMARVYVADPEGGFPHGTGRALDFNLSVGGTNSGDIAAQKKTKDYAWLLKNAAKYGFYNYQVEPWHWEFNPPESKEVPEICKTTAKEEKGESDMWKKKIVQEAFDLGFIKDSAWIDKADQPPTIWFVCAMIINLYKKLKG